MSTFPFVGKRFTPDQFDAYVKALPITWGPNKVILHNTAAPSLAQRPNGLTDQHLQNLLTFYRDTRKWSSGPHLFITDKDIIVFCDLNKPGVHSPSFNKTAFGVECLGDYDSEEWNSGRGALVQANALRACAALCRKMMVGAEALKLHKEDPATDHACPGKKVDKAAFVAKMVLLLKPATPVEPEQDGWRVVLNGKNLPDVTTVNSRPYMPVRTLAEALGCEVAVEGNVVTLRKGEA